MISEEALTQIYSAAGDRLPRPCNYAREAVTGVTDVIGAMEYVWDKASHMGLDSIATMCLLIGYALGYDCGAGATVPACPRPSGAGGDANAAAND